MEEVLNKYSVKVEDGSSILSKAAIADSNK
jgi:hypothetical protein